MCIQVRIEVCRCMSSIRAKDDFVLCTQGDRGDCMYILLKGEVDIFEDEVGQKRRFLVTQNEGSSFGELAIMGDESERFRTATVVCKGDCIFGVLSRFDYRRFILKMRQDEKKEVVRTRARARGFVGYPRIVASSPSRAARQNAHIAHAARTTGGDDAQAPLSIERPQVGAPENGDDVEADDSVPRGSLRDAG